MSCWSGFKTWISQIWTKTTPPKRDDVVHLAGLTQPLLEGSDEQWWSEVDQDSMAFSTQALSFDLRTSESNSDSDGEQATEVNPHYSNFLMHDSVIAQRIGNDACEIIASGADEKHVGKRSFDHDPDGSQPWDTAAPGVGGSASTSLYFSTVVQGSRTARAERVHVAAADRGAEQAEQKP